MNASVENELPDLPAPLAWLLALLLSAALFAAIAPTLTWPQFTGGNEDIVVQTALEMRHGGPKLLPRMMGEPRVKKPPLVAWITALSMREKTIADLDDPVRHEQAYVDLAWQVRWTGLAAGCVTVLATFELGRLIFGNRAGLMSAVVVSSNLLFLKYMRQSTSDVHLAMWVTIANACFAHGLLRGRWWVAATLGAIATGLAFLCKGPVALLETALPLVGAIVLLRQRAVDVAAESDHRRAARVRLIQVATSVLVFLLIAAPWFVYVYRNVPGVWHTWFSEVTRNGATDLQPGSPGIYALISPMTWPWVVFGFVGLIAIWRSRRDRRQWLPVMYVVLPLLVMVFFRDRKERYLLPMIGPASIVCGYGISLWLRSAATAIRRDRAGDRAVVSMHLLLLMGGGIALAIAGTTQPTTDGGVWFSKSLSTWICLAMLVIVALAFLLSRRTKMALVLISWLTMMGLAALFMYGYTRGNSGRSSFKLLAEAIRAQAPTAGVYDWLEGDRRVEEEFAIYLNRPVLRADPATLTASDRPTVVILRQADKTPMPQLPPPWVYLSKTTDHKNVWWAFVRYP